MINKLEKRTSMAFSFSMEIEKLHSLCIKCPINPEKIGGFDIAIFTIRS